MDHSGLGCVRELRRGQHACLIYDHGEDPHTAVAPFAAAGLEAGERCVYVVGEHDPARIERSLTAAGVDFARQLQRGALVLLSRWEVSFPNGEFDPTAMIGFVRQAITQALADGFTGLRVVAEMTWALQMGVGANKLIHYEALGNHLYPDEPLVAVCMYDRSRFPVAVCHDALRVHPWVAVGEVTYDNLYYEPPATVIDGAAADTRVQWMLEQLQRVREAEVQRRELYSARLAREEAEASAQAKDALLSMLAHELRTPLTSMLMYTQASLRKLEAAQAADLPSLRRSLEVVARQATKQARLIDQVLDAARLASEQLPLTLEHCDLAALVREVVELTQAAAPEHPLVVQVSSQAEMMADPLRIEQVLVNLLDNARKYTPPGTSIEVGILPESEGIALVVRDHGAGIPTEDHGRIFERFHRLRSDQKGVGLGLHISREIVRMHGGDLLVETPPDGGTRFIARFPRHEAASQKPGRQEKDPRSTPRASEEHPHP
ncbi:MEDS domain-containing protein [Hyalangium gracile]|uniref:MEDS domain-containing protein n=1 Tax=Hyalangium gracile TaxID=394092 RepID=UPI001CCD6B17|nr:MEDS domain-containing protein [Hyalangium gracile]